MAKKIVVSTVYVFCRVEAVLWMVLLIPLYPTRGRNMLSVFFFFYIATLDPKCCGLRPPHLRVLCWPPDVFIQWQQSLK